MQMKTRLGSMITVAAGLLLASSATSFGAAIFTENFNTLSGGSAGTQYQTSLGLKVNASVTGWVNSGSGGTMHAVNLNGSGNWAIMFHNSNTITLSTGIAANDSGVTYQVDFDYGTAVYANGVQATAAGDSLYVKVLRPNGTTLASGTYTPGAWSNPGNANLNAGLHGILQYVGDGSGVVKLKIVGTASVDRFQGEIDNLSVSVLSAPLSASVTAPANGQQFLSGSSVTGTVTVAYGTMPYAVTFYTNSAPAWSTNNASTNVFTIPLGALADGTYTNYAMVVDSAGTPVTATSVTNTFTVGQDTTAPTPNPMTFAVAPWAMDNTTMIMTATTATDALTPPVYYYFENTTNGNNSGWVSSTVWTNTGLTQGAVYGYRVKARDSAPTLNETTNSAVFNALAESVETLTWDSNTGTSGAQDGTGDWLAANQWWNGVGNPSWMNSKPNSAVIGNGGAGGTITLGNVIAGSVTFTNFTGTYMLTGGSLTNSAGITVAANAGSVTLSTPIGGSGGMVKNGASWLVLSGTHTYTGGTVSKGGWFSLGYSAIPGTGPITLDGGNFQVSGGTLTNAIIINSGSVDVRGGNSFWNGPVTLNAPRSHWVNPYNLTVNGTISGTGGFSYEQGSWLALNGTNTYSGGTTNISGELRISNTNALGTGHVCFSFNIGGWGQNPVSITAMADLSGGTGVRNDIVLRTDGAINANNNIQLSGVISGAGNLTKAGNSSLLLSGTNTYTGTTTNSAGTLVVSGSLASTNIAVSATATLVLLNKTSLSTNTVLRYAVGATNTLNYSGKMYIRALYTNNVPLPVGEYGSANLPQFITGTGLLNTGPLPPKGTMISFF
jgi:autotransporter-associated beta strand protein